jgi:hypothetical protein
MCSHWTFVRFCIFTIILFQAFSELLMSVCMCRPMRWVYAFLCFGPAHFHWELCTIPEAYSPWSQSSQFMHMFDLDPVTFIRSSSQFQKHGLLETRVYTSCTCVIWTMLHSSEPLHNPRSIIFLKPVFTFNEFFWVGPFYCNQKLCAICLDTSVHSSCICFIWTILS